MSPPHRVKYQAIAAPDALFSTPSTILTNGWGNSANPGRMAIRGRQPLTKYFGARRKQKGSPGTKERLSTPTPTTTSTRKLKQVVPAMSGFIVLIAPYLNHLPKRTRETRTKRTEAAKQRGSKRAKTKLEVDKLIGGRKSR